MKKRNEIKELREWIKTLRYFFPKKSFNTKVKIHKLK